MNQGWTTSLTARQLTEIKLELLSNGVAFEHGFLEAYGPEYIEKRWAYGNSDEMRLGTRIPQEVKLGDIIVAVHFVPTSPWKLTRSERGFCLKHDEDEVTPISFPLRPEFYQMSLSSGIACKTIGTLYGGGSLGIFAHGQCYYFSIDKQCAFCSLQPTRSTYGDHVLDVKPDMAAELVEIALRTDAPAVKQVMLNGGNHRDNNAGFLKQVDILRRIYETLAGLKHEPQLEVHLITMPPDDLKLLDELRGMSVKIAINLEVFSPKRFEAISPGKSALYGRDKLIAALEKAVIILGAGNVYTIFVGGLEPIESLAKGLDFVAERGITPIINVFHKDPESKLARYPRASVQDLRKMGKALQLTFREYDCKPFYMNCGRNSLDSEAYYGYFE